MMSTNANDHENREMMFLFLHLCLTETKATQIIVWMRGGARSRMIHEHSNRKRKFYTSRCRDKWYPLFVAKSRLHRRERDPHTHTQEVATPKGFVTMPATNTNTDAASSSPATPSAPKQQADEVAPSLAFRALKVLAVLGIFYFAGGWQYLLESLNGSVPMALLVTSFFLFAGFITDTNDMVGQPHED